MFALGLNAVDEGFGPADAGRGGKGFPADEGLAAAASLCRDRGLAIEVSTFCKPGALHSPDEAIDASVERHRRALEGIALRSLHGPFWDLYTSSLEPAILDLCRRLHGRALRIAAALRADTYVVHANYNPAYPAPIYHENFIRRLLEFWRPFADEAARAGIVIVFENHWERGPEFQRELVDRGNHPSIKAAFDNGHALHLSKTPAAAWIRGLGRRLVHCHLHDNDGESDQHLGAGAGIEDWPALVGALREHAPGARCVAESRALEDRRRTLDRILLEAGRS